jgi:hypothetical protein
LSFHCGGSRSPSAAVASSSALTSRIALNSPANGLPLTVTALAADRGEAEDHPHGRGLSDDVGLSRQSVRGTAGRGHKHSFIPLASFVAVARASYGQNQASQHQWAGVTVIVTASGASASPSEGDAGHRKPPPDSGFVVQLDNEGQIPCPRGYGDRLGHSLRESADGQ